MQDTTRRLRRQGSARRAALASLALLGLSGAGNALQAGTTPRVPAPGGWARVIVTLKGPLTQPDQARLGALKAYTYRHLPLIQALALRLPRRSVHNLGELPFVRSVSPDAGVTKCDEFTTGSSGAVTAWQQYSVTGAGVTVAVLDSGIKEHEDLNNPTQKGDEEDDSLGGSNILVHQDMTGAPPPPGKKDKDAQPLYDLCGHGTHVAGIIAGNGRASLGKRFFHTFYGIAPQANLVDVRVLDQNGQADISTVIAGLQWVVDHKSQYGIRVINLSLGHPVVESYTTDPLCQAVESAWKAGIVVVCAAGNDGRASTTNQAGLGNEGWGSNYGSINSPANDPCVITVGAMKQDSDHIGDKSYDHIATYSGRGPSRLDLVLKPDLVAPGNRVISLEASLDYLSTHFNATNQLPFSAYLNTKSTAPSDNYFVLSGTSMAAPVVAGAAALLLQADPTLTPDTVKARLMLSADKWATPLGSGDPLTYGAGYLDIPAALANTAVAALPTLSPTLSANPDGTLSLTMDRAAWGTATTNGSQAAGGTGLWGTGITDLRAAWGTSVTFAPGVDANRAAWGTNSVASDRAAWGTSAVWSDRAAWGTSTSAVDLSDTALQGESGTAPPPVTHLLWSNTDHRAMFWNVGADGSFTVAGGYGPYTDGSPDALWTATALATGPDGVSHILWNNTDHRVMLWNVYNDGSFTVIGGYGPYTDQTSSELWSAVGLSVGSDNVMHLLWSNTDHRAMFWNVGQDGSFSVKAGYGPYTDNAPGNIWEAAGVSTGPDGVSHILWSNSDHRAMLWDVSGSDGSFSVQGGYGPYTDNSPNALWSAAGVSTGPDNVSHLLWNNSDNRAMLGDVSGSSGSFSVRAGYGPYIDNAPGNTWEAAGVSTGPDGVSHILWSNSDHRAMLWDMSSGGGSFSVRAGYGPYTDGAAQNLWSAVGVSAGP